MDSPESLLHILTIGDLNQVSILLKNELICCEQVILSKPSWDILKILKEELVRVFSASGFEGLLGPTQGSAAFWIYLVSSHEIDNPAAHGRCHVLKGQK